ncbi:MAG: hypothetical protein AAB389_03610 [Patescibacteria group bacterium]
MIFVAQIALGVLALGLAWMFWKIMKALGEKYDHQPEVNYKALVLCSALMMGILIAGGAGVVLIVGAVTNALCS